MRKRKFLSYIFALIIALLPLLSIPALAAQCEDGAHIFAAELIQEATGDEPGLRRYTCTVCGYSYDEVIPASGHSWGEWIVDTEPSCGVEGRAHKVCGQCGDVEVQTLPALEHDYAAATTPPSCLEAEKTVYTCTHCGDSYTQTGAALGHNYVLSGQQAEEAGVDGYKEYTCTRCGDSYLETIPALTGPAAASAGPPEDERPEAPATTVTKAEASVERQLDLEPVSQEAGEKSGSMNMYDLVFLCAMLGAAAGFTALTLPYIRVLGWAKRKKSDIIRRRRGAA